jgi:heat shock protein 1/8
MTNFENLCIGIDFGTTNSCLSIWDNNKSILITDIDESNIIPTVIEISNNKKIIGKEAYIRKDIFNKTNNDKSTKSTFLVYEIKKLLGKKFSEINTNTINMLAYTIIADPDDNIKIIDNNNLTSYYPEEIATHLFMSFKARAETFLSKKFNLSNELSNELSNGFSIDKAVISVPAYFNKIQREIIKNCASNAGFNVLRLINEPTAAALCYGLGKNQIDNGKNIIVFDFGGGTLDVSLLNISDGLYEVLGSCGNNNLGGSDFDNKIMEYCIDNFINANSLDYQEFIDNVQENNIQKLKYLAEQAKIALTDKPNAKIKINSFYNNIDLIVNISRDTFNDICGHLINIIIKPLNDVLNCCDLEKKEISEIIMVGGMTRIPIIRYNVERYFNKDVNCSIDPDTVVSIGAAIQGYMLLNNSSIEDKLLLIDRTSLSIGLETSGGIMDILIPRGTIIPVKKYKKYTTDTDNVDSIDIKIYEGERKLTKDNFLIGDFTLTGIEKEKRGIPEIQITFEIDADSIVKIKAEDLKNPLNKKIIQVSGNKQNLTSEQLETIIENAKKMDQLDRIDKMKKESYLSLIDSSNRILENLSSNEIKIDVTIKENISFNVTEILEWLKTQDYLQIDTDKYKELLHDYKINYSIYLIQNIAPIINLDSANDTDTNGIEIYDDDINNKKYSEQIKYIRSVIDEYDTMNKQLKIYSFMDVSNIDIKNILIPKLNMLFQQISEYSNDILIKFFIDNQLNDDIVNQSITKLNELDIEFKSHYDKLDSEFNIINKLIDKIKEKELYYLNLLDNTVNTDNSDNSDNSNHTLTELIINDINNKLENILEYDSIIYKINNGYIPFEYSKIIEIINILDQN